MENVCCHLFSSHFLPTNIEIQRDTYRYTVLQFYQLFWTQSWTLMGCTICGEFIKWMKSCQNLFIAGSHGCACNVLQWLSLLQTYCCNSDSHSLTWGIKIVCPSYLVSDCYMVVRIFLSVGSTVVTVCTTFCNITEFCSLPTQCMSFSWFLNKTVTFPCTAISSWSLDWKLDICSQEGSKYIHHKKTRHFPLSHIKNKTSTKKRRLKKRTHSHNFIK